MPAINCRRLRCAIAIRASLAALTRAMLKDYWALWHFLDPYTSVASCVSSPSAATMFCFGNRTSNAGPRLNICHCPC